MKLAVLSDIHGNWPALQAVVADIDAWQPDQVLVNGDIVNDGPSSPACWAYIAGRQATDGWHVLRGNHEEYVAGWLAPEPSVLRPGPAYDLTRISRWTFDQLNGGRVGRPAGALGMDRPRRYNMGRHARHTAGHSRRHLSLHDR